MMRAKTMEEMTPRNPNNGPGLYVHIPFCAHKCAYCNFASGTFSSLDPDRYVEAVTTELGSQSPSVPYATVFVGGGTPSYLEDETLHKLCEAIRHAAPDAIEWTVENNPNSLTASKIALMREAGVTRLSLGIQSLNPDELKFLERVHSVDEAHRAMDLAAAAFPDSWSADLIYGMPNQTDMSWEQTLDGVLTHNPPHVSAYELTYESETPLGQQLKRGELNVPPDEILLHRQEMVESKLNKAGLQRYEISNYARPGAECRHNDFIWQGGDFDAVGNGAHGRRGHQRWRHTHAPGDYVKAIEAGDSPIRETDEDTSESERLMTTLLLGLRRREGVALPKGVALPESLKDFVNIENNQIRCTPEGWNVLVRVVVDLMSEL